MSKTGGEAALGDQDKKFVVNFPLPIPLLTHPLIGPV